MQTIGIIGGMSWESTQLYYHLINEETKRRLGGLHSAPCLIYSFDFAPIEKLQQQGRWEEMTTRMVKSAKTLERAGAELLIISSNTMHRMADDVQNGVTIPLLHIADPTGKAIQEQQIHRVGLLGTKYTMEQDFYKGRLAQKFGLEVLVPAEDDRRVVNSIIYDELCVGVIEPSSKTRYLEIMQRLSERGAQAIILGCTEIGLLVGQNDTALSLFDTTRLHTQAAVSAVLGASGAITKH